LKESEAVKAMYKLLRKKPSLAAWLLLTPAVFWLILFFMAPLVIVVAYSFLERGTYGGVVWALNLQNFQRVFDSLYLGAFQRSLLIAFATTFFCLLLGYPLAFFIASRPTRQRNALLLALMILGNFLIRTTPG
jgi:spermidine/putrescine transport system permease protein